MTDTITVTGLVATAPRHIKTSEGLTITSFRLASNQRRFDRSANKWVPGDTNWYTVTSFRHLATNSASSIFKGDRVLVTGRLRVRNWGSGEKNGTSVELEADALGHDLSWGSASFTRTISSSPSTESAEPPAEGAAAQNAAGETGGQRAFDPDEANPSVETVAWAPAAESRAF